MSELLKDPMFFYTIAFIIFMALAWKYGRTPLLAMIDADILKIRDELEQAQKLRVEAEAILEVYKKKQAEALADAETILKHAHEEGERLKHESELALKESLARHQQQVTERIRVAEIEALAAVRASAIELAMAMARKNLESQIDDAQAGKLLDQAIAEIPMLAATKAKAA